MIISESDTWTVEEGDQHIDQDIVIEPGVTLTINCQVFLTPAARIIIKPGGELHLEGNETNFARISSGCGEMWNGIEVWGDPTQAQTLEYQGKVYLSNGIIENAISGVKLANPGYNPEGGGQGQPELYYPSGGIVEAINAKFINNLMDIRFYPYRSQDENGKPVPNLSSFQNCEFLTTKGLVQDFDPLYHVRADGVNEVKFRGCTFSNTRDNAIPFQERGMGVYSNNSQLRFEPQLSAEKCKFEKMQYGI